MVETFPVAKSLFYRKVLNSATCCLCSNAWESIGHSLFSCKHAKPIWKEQYSSVAIPATTNRTDPAEHHPWLPPLENKLKLNVDAVVDSSRNKIGLGAIIRDSHGQVLASLAKQVIGNFKSQKIEAKAIFYSLC
ncbi:hypothetical protein F8388_023488 [Cannabis sativa]|uniref:Reverse transcriptase zinc-binding domain-containing protein n=1 Tax=Cannabis sativa TaxID=3483 RepID=A0A7J6GLJ5_CANSA|nr:hypothetical protein F8388_023488 [Cannabis sativa]